MYIIPKNREAAVSNPFRAIGSFFEKVIHFVISPGGRKKIADALKQAQDLIAPALQACETIATLTPTRSDDELFALAQRYALGTITPEMITNDAIISGIMKHAAMVELQHLTGTTADPRVLDLAIQSAYLVYKQAKVDMVEKLTQEGAAQAAKE